MASIDPSAIREHMEVVAVDGTSIGKVDHMQDGKIKLTKTDSPDHQHHLVPLSWVGRIDTKVELTLTLAEIKAAAGTSIRKTDAVPEAVEQDAVPTKS